MGAVYALPLSLPFVVDSLSERLAEAFYAAALFGIPVAAAVIQAHAARATLVEARGRVVPAVMRSTLAFFCGVSVVLFLVLLPLAHVLGSFDALEGTDLSGGLFFLVFVGVFGLVMLLTGAVVVGVVMATQRIRRRRRSPPATAE
jgi:hypothetical protein